MAFDPPRPVFIKVRTTFFKTVFFHLLNGKPPPVKISFCEKSAVMDIFYTQMAPFIAFLCTIYVANMPTRTYQKWYELFYKWVWPPPPVYNNYKKTDVLVLGDVPKYKEWEGQETFIEGLTFYNLEEIEAHARNLKKKHDAVQDKRANEEKDSDQTFKTMWEYSVWT